MRVHKCMSRQEDRQRWNQIGIDTDILHGMYPKVLVKEI